jgi:phosphate:Na+ symporter
MQTPTVAVLNAHLELCRMCQIAYDNYKLAIEAFYQQDPDKVQFVLKNESVLNYLNREITSWLIQIRALRLSPSDVERTGVMLHITSDIERIGDHAENIAEYTLAMRDHNTKISEIAMKELKELTDVSLQILKMSMEILETSNKALFSEVALLEEKTDVLSQEYIENHIERLKNQICDPRGGVIFTDMVHDLERCGDHALNIANATLKKAN